jgi:hypothetical protein
MSDTLEKIDTYTKEPGDDEKFSHYAKKNDIEQAILAGVPCTALCGKTWIPTRDPERFPICPECKDIFENTRFADDR